MGQILTANTSSISDPDGIGEFLYQWARENTDISGSTSATHTITQDDVGSRITVTVTWTDGGGNTETKKSSATDTIKDVALKSLSVSSSSSSARQMYPEFDPATFHYAVECGGEDTVTVNAAAKDQSARVTIDGSEKSQLSLTGLTLYSDIVIEVGRVQRYVIHCFPSDFLYMTIVSKKGGREKGFRRADLDCLH